MKFCPILQINKFKLRQVFNYLVAQLFNIDYIFHDAGRLGIHIGMRTITYYM